MSTGLHNHVEYDFLCDLTQFLKVQLQSVWTALFYYICLIEMPLETIVFFASFHNHITEASVRKTVEFVLINIHFRLGHHQDWYAWKLLFFILKHCFKFSEFLKSIFNLKGMFIQKLFSSTALSLNLTKTGSIFKVLPFSSSAKTLGCFLRSLCLTSPQLMSWLSTPSSPSSKSVLCWCTTPHPILCCVDAWPHILY